MSKRRGLSLEEKRVKLLELFFEKKSFFQLKELEKLAQKEKGITSMSVKDVLQSLVDDGMVDTDRIGTSNYFWSFPSKAFNIRKGKLEQLRNSVGEMDGKKAVVQRELEAAQVGRENTEAYTQLLKAVESKRKAKESLATELDHFKACDPKTLESLCKQTEQAVEASNRWTENIFAVKSWCKNKFSVEEGEMDKQFGIPEDLDYLK